MVLSLLVSTCILLGPGSAKASAPEGEPVKHLAEGVVEELIVTAARSQLSTLELAYSVHRLDSEALAQQMPRNLPEALAELPGVLVQKTANGQGSPFVRGFTGYRTLALIDGVRYNNSVYRDGPNEYFSLIDAAGLDRIELLSGPASTLYGSDAIGGTLSLQTQRADFEAELAGDFFIYASQDLRLATAENSRVSRTSLQLGEGQSWGLQLGYSNKDFGDVEAAQLGSLPHTGYDEYNYDLRLDVALSDEWLLTALHQATSQDDVWRTHSTVYSVPFEGTEAGTDLRRLKGQTRELSYLKFSGRELDGLVDSAVLTLSSQRWDEDGDRIKGSGKRIVDSFDSRMWGLDLQLGSLIKLDLGRQLALTYGFDFYRDNVDSARTDCSLDDTANKRTDGCVGEVRIQGPIGDDSGFDQWGAYVQAELPLGERWLLTAGSRYSHVSASIGAYEDPNSGLSAAFSDDWSDQVSSLRVSYALSNSHRIWGGLSQSFRAPNVADLSRFGKSRSSETEVAATELEPETFLTYEVGFKGQAAVWDYSASVYYTRINDFIASTPTGRVINGLTEVSKQNAGRGYVQGLEVSGGYWLSDSWRLTGNITWLQGQLSAYLNTGSDVMTVEPMSRIMPLTSTLALHWQESGLWAQLQLTAVSTADELSRGDMGDTERIPPGGTPGYFLVSASGGQQINDHLRVTAALNNLLDEAYRSHGSGSNEPGRGLVLGLNLSF